VESEELEAGSEARSGSEDEDGGPHPLDEEAENDMFNVDDEMYMGPNESNEELGGNGGDVYKF